MNEEELENNWEDEKEALKFLVKKYREDGLKLVAENERLKHEADVWKKRAQAIMAEDPGPTSWAYEQACKANENKRQRIELLEHQSGIYKKALKFYKNLGATKKGEVLVKESHWVAEAALEQAASLETGELQ